MRITKINLIKHFGSVARIMILIGIGGALVTAGSDVLLKSHMIKDAWLNSNLSNLPWVAFSFLLATVCVAMIVTTALQPKKADHAPRNIYSLNYCLKEIAIMVSSGACFAFVIKIINILPLTLNAFTFAIDLIAVILGSVMLNTFINNAFRYLYKRIIKLGIA